MSRFTSEPTSPTSSAEVTPPRLSAKFSPKYSIGVVPLGGVVLSLHAGGLGGSRSNTIGLPSRKGRIRSAERVEAHLSASRLRHLLSARCADNGRFDERRSPCRSITQRHHARFPTAPNLRHLKDQAKDLLKAGAAASITDAQFKIARLYGFASWPKLKAHVDSLEEIGQLKQAIDTNDIVRVKTMMTRNPTLHSAPLGYGKDGPLTWVAECRVPWESPSPARLAMATWMLEARVGRAPGGRRTSDASRAQRISHPDDGASRVPRRGCERPVARTFPDHLCPVRVIGSGRS